MASSHKGSIEQNSRLAEGDILIDVRHPADVDAQPLSVPGNPVLCIPFFSLEQRLDELDRQQTYRLYCDKGIMSRLQAQLMRDKGFAQVTVFTGKVESKS
jgi:thiamine biosynthesis protein ThiI